jgi:hypothetical protein
MKKMIRNLTDNILVLNIMTYFPKTDNPVWNDEILKSDDVKRALEAKEIEIVEIPD